MLAAILSRTEKGVMNTYRVVLTSLGTVFIEADSVVQTEDALAFYRGEFRCAYYPSGMVKGYEVAPNSGPVPFFTPEREDSQCP
jgi:hypothetical protein